LDGVYSNTSTVKYAGRGAFATRDVVEGGLISPAPLLIIDSKDWLNMYGTKFEPSRNDKRKFVSRDNKSEVLHQQILLNYCFGHPRSSLLLYPYGMGTNFINHKSTNNGDNSNDNNNNNGPNAKIIWSKQAYNKPNLQNLPLKDLLKADNVHTSLGFDIVATRYIQADEEIFINYGDDWEHAWKSHVDDGNYPHIWPIRALDMNTKSHNNAASGDDNILYTVSEREETVQAGGKDPYDDSFFMTACYYATEELGKDDTSPRTVNDFSVYQFPRDQDLSKMIAKLLSCKILERDVVVSNDEDGTKTYSYRVFFLSEGEDGGCIVKGLPREAITFVDQPYSSDMHMPKTFRHSIGIPDDIFPDVWCDLK